MARAYGKGGLGGPVDPLASDWKWEKEKRGDTVLSLISAPGACKIEMKNLYFSLFLISVVLLGVSFTK